MTRFNVERILKQFWNRHIERLNRRFFPFLLTTSIHTLICFTCRHKQTQEKFFVPEYPSMVLWSILYIDFGILNFESIHREPSEIWASGYEKKALRIVVGLCNPQKWISHTQKPVPRHKKKSIWSNQSYKIFKIKNSAEFSELNYCITLKLFDGIEFFLCLGIGFWVWEIHFWGLQSPTTILIAFFSYPEAHISEGSLWIISKFRILKSMHKMIHKTIDGCSGTKSFSWVSLCRPVA